MNTQGNDVIVKEDSNGDLYIEIPSDLMNQVGWDFGDNIIWEELPDGNWSLRKEDDILETEKDSS